MKLSALKSKIGNIVEGPQGLQLPESIARRVDELQKSLPKECTYRRRSIGGAEFSFDPGERADVSFITTDAVDRENEVFLPKGGDWKDYNQVVMWCHTYSPTDGWIGLPIGTCKWMKYKTTPAFAGIIAKTQYHAKPEDWGDGPWLPSAINALQRQTPPTCTAKSIGCIPTNVRAATKDELVAHPDWEGKRIYDKWLGYEYSVCPIPMNQSCEMIAVSKGLDAASTDLLQREFNRLSKVIKMDVASESGGADGGFSTMSLHAPGLSACKELATGGKVLRGDEEADAAGSGAHCLGISSHADGRTLHDYAVTKDMGDGGMMLSMTSLAKCYGKAMTAGHHDIGEAAKGLMQMCMAKSIRIYTSKSIIAAQQRQMNELRATVGGMLDAAIVDAFCRAMGRP